MIAMPLSKCQLQDELQFLSQAKMTLIHGDAMAAQEKVYAWDLRLPDLPLSGVVYAQDRVVSGTSLNTLARSNIHPNSKAEPTHRG